jgi:hypothetical protein
VNISGLIASSKLKSTTRPIRSSERFCSAETTAGALESPLPVPATCAPSTATSATELTPEAWSVKSAQTLAMLPRSSVRVWAPESKARTEPVRSKVWPSASRLQWATSSALSGTTCGPLNWSTITSAPRPAFICASATV